MVGVLNFLVGGDLSFVVGDLSFVVVGGDEVSEAGGGERGSDASREVRLTPTKVISSSSRAAGATLLLFPLPPTTLFHPWSWDPGEATAAAAEA